MSAQLGVGLSGQSITQAKSARRGRQLNVHVRAQDGKAEPFGTSILKGLPSLPFGTGTLSLKPQKPGTSFLQSLTGGVNKSRQAPDAKTVYVAGATGRVGARVVRELVQAGFRVRAGVRNVAEAQQSLDVAQAYGLLSAAEAKQVSLVSVDYSKGDAIREAIGGARKVVCALGAAESDALNFANVKKVDFEFTTALINAAAAVGVDQFVLVTSLGTGKVGFPAAILNLFGGVLVWKRESEKVLEASGMAYTIVRPGGMERPTDTFKKTHNMVLSKRDTTFGGNVSRLQVAELVSTILINPELAENKVLEVTAATTAPRMTYQELLAGITPDLTREEQLARQASGAAAREELEEAEANADKARATLAAADSRVKELADRLKEAKAQEAEVKAKVASVLKEGASAEKALEAARAAANKATLNESAARAVLEAAKKAASQGQLLDKKQQKAVADQVLNPPPAPKAQPALAAAGAGAGAAPPKPAFSFFGAPAAPQQAPAASAPAAAGSRAVSPPPKAVSPPPKAESPAPEGRPAAKSPGFNFGSLFGIPEAVDAGGEAPKVPAKEVSPPPAPAARAASTPAPRTPSPAPPPPPKAATAPAPAAPAKPTPSPSPAPQAAQPKPLFGGFFANLSKAMSPDQGKDEEEEKAPAPAAPPKPAAAAAPPPPPPAPKPVAEAPRAPSKPMAPVEDAQSVEARMLASLAEERREKALAVAKARLAKEAEQVEALKAMTAKAAQQKAPSPTPEPEAPKRVAPAAPKPAAAAAPAKPAPAAAAASKPAPAAAAPSAASVEAEKKKVQAWIAAWQAKQGAAAPKAAAPAAGSSNGVPAAKAAKTSDYDAAAADKAKQEAKAWIAKWQASQAANVKK